MQPVTNNPLIKVSRKIKRSGLKIDIQPSGHPVLVMRRWNGKVTENHPNLNKILKH